MIVAALVVGNDTVGVIKPVDAPTMQIVHARKRATYDQGVVPDQERGHGHELPSTLT